MYHLEVLLTYPKINFTQFANKTQWSFLWNSLLQTWHLIYKLYHRLKYFENIMKVIENHNERSIHLIFMIIKSSGIVLYFLIFFKTKPWYKIPIYWAKLNVPHFHLIQRTHILDNVQLGILRNKSFHCTICFIWKKHSTLISKLTYQESLITFKHHQLRSNFLSHSCEVCICDVNNRLPTEISFCKLLVYISASIKKTHKTV